jgi:hypothetical protein
MGKAVSYVTDPRFLVGVAVGWLVIPYASKAIQMRRLARTAPPAA